MNYLIIFYFVIFGGLVIAQNLSDVDRCLNFIQNNLKHKNMSQTLGGLVGMGWDDLTNEYTLPILAVTYKQCKSDPDNHWLIPDNVVLIPIKNTALDRTSSTFNSFDEYMSTNSNKLTITGSASFKGKGSVSASFSKENADSKREFVKVDSIMLQNKLSYLAYDLIANEHGSMDEGFIRRVKEIAAAVDEGNRLKGQFLAEVLIADYGTHVINKATAAAEIIQETYINRKEEFKGEDHMSAIKVGVSGEFDGQSYGGGGSISNENKKESAKNETKTTTKTRSLIKTRGGPHVNRMGTPNINDSMIHVDSLVGINQKGKLIHDIIPAVPLPEFSRMVKYTVKELIFNAVKEYYKYNSFPGCMKLDSENYNPLANSDDGSCGDPGVLYSFGGIYQSCNPIHSWPVYQDVEFGTQCEEYERRNRITGNFSCPNGTDQILIDFDKIEFFDRTVKKEVRKCLRFLPLVCWYESDDVKVLDEILIETFWCSSNYTLPQDKVVQHNKTDLDLIMPRPVLSAIDRLPKLLEACFPLSFDLIALMEEEEVCTILPKDETTDDKMITWKTVKEKFIHSSIQQIAPGNSKHYLNITSLQLQIIKDYPNLLEALLPILKLKEDVKSHPDIFKSAAKNPLILQQVLFNEKQSFQHKEPQNFAYFGGIFQNSNNNPFTGKSECPPYFEEIEIIGNLKICISYDSSLQWPIRLGKIFSCNSAEKWCPKGYSEYLAGTIKSCDFNYCIRFHTRDEIIQPAINKPPFIDYKIATSETSISSKSSSNVRF